MRRLSFALAASLAGLTAASAHHSAALFDTTVEIVLEGTIAEVEWKNPHIYLAIEAIGPDGEPSVLAIEASSSSVLLPIGFTRDAVSVGDRVTSRGAARRRPERRRQAPRRTALLERGRPPARVRRHGRGSRVSCGADELHGAVGLPARPRTDRSRLRPRGGEAVSRRQLIRNRPALRTP